MLITYPGRVPEDIATQLKEMGIAADLAQDWWDEYRARDAQEFAAAVAAQHAVSRQNYMAEHRPLDGLGQNTFRIAKRLADYLWKHWGAYSLTPEFRRDLVKQHPEFFFTPKVQRLASIIHPGLSQRMAG